MQFFDRSKDNFIAFFCSVITVKADFHSTQLLARCFRIIKFDWLIAKESERLKKVKKFLIFSNRL